MALTAITAKQKNKFLNIVLVIITIIVSLNIYKKHAGQAESITIQKDSELKKKKVLESIVYSEKMIEAYKRLLVRKDPSFVMNSINNLARDSGIEVLSIKPVSEMQQVFSIRIPYDLTIRADNYHSLGKFISRLESHQLVLMVDSMSIKYDNQTRKINANLKLSYIVIKE